MKRAIINTMMTAFFRGAYHWVTRFIQLQLFVTVLSLPILIVWGLPVSLLSPLGNLLFGPILTLFLFLSSLLFFTELFYIPNTYIAYPLELLSAKWLAGMNCADQRVLIGFTQPPLWFLIAIPLAACLIIQHKKTSSVIRSSICLTALLIVASLYLKLISTPHDLCSSISCNGGQVHVIYSNKKTVIIDPGVIGKRISAASWVEYTLIPEIIKLTGSTTIDHFIMLQPSQMTFEAATTLCSKMIVGTIYLPCWEGTLNKSGWRAFFNLKRCASERGCSIKRIGTKPISIPLGNEDPLMIAPLETTIITGPISYPALHAWREAENFNVNCSKFNKN